MNVFFSRLIGSELNLSPKFTEHALLLLEGGATVPFISRYRKEATGGMDEVQVSAVKERYEKLCELEKRKATVLETIGASGKLSPELEAKIRECWDATALEDLYLPYKPKRQTRAEIARKRGLEPLAKIILSQRERDIRKRALSFVNGEIPDMESAVSGAKDIIAEWVCEDGGCRNIVRNAFRREGIISSKVTKGKESEGAKFHDYFDFREPLRRCSSHRLLALRRGEEEGILKVSIAPETEGCLERIIQCYVQGSGECSQFVEEAVRDSYKRLLRPSIETEFAHVSKLRADEEAIRVFADNLRQLLLAAPLGEKRTLAIDPGFRTGCKVVCLDAQGNLLHNETIYPHPPQNERSKAANKVVKLVESYKIEAIAIGNGTAGRETEEFITSLRFDRKVQVFAVSENGASIYSASKVAREEFPDYDVTVRGAVSIGRRLLDPLAELVKINPKSIGVGQYQHDVDQTLLRKALDQTVESCVNSVGVNLNTASKHLLTYVSGLGPTLAQNIVAFRTENGPFRCRQDLLKVPRMGAKAFEQSAGFLRIPDGVTALDNTAVHPESYGIVERMAADLGCSINDLIAQKELRKQIVAERYCSDTVGLPTLLDILSELEKPGRDPRSTVKVFEFDRSVKTIADIRTGMLLPGIVTNITNFGCFVDMGIKESGLVHISELTDRFVSNPSEVVSIHQHVVVKVLSVDLERKRVQLTMKGVPQP